MLGSDGKPLLSWRVQILGFMEEMHLYRKFQLDESWESPHNKALIAESPRSYRSNWSQATKDGQVVFGTPRGKQTFFGEHGGRSISEFTDSWRHTIRIVEYDPAHAPIWTEPAEISYDPRQPRAGLGTRWRIGFFQEPSCFATAMDGTLCYIPLSMDPGLLRALFTINGAEPIKDLPWFAVLERPGIGTLLAGSMLISLFFIVGSIPVAARVLQGKPIAPGEVLWLLIAAQQIVFIANFTIFYRYEALPSFRPQPLTLALWFTPRLVGTIIILLAIVVPFGVPPGWRRLFIALAICWAGVAYYGTFWHMHWWPEESLVTIAGPVATALTAIAMMCHTWGIPHDHAQVNGRPRAHWIAIFVAFVPMIWFWVWWASGHVLLRCVLFSYILD